MRAFRKDLLNCECGGRRVVLAAVQDKAALEKILRHPSTSSGQALPPIDQAA